MTQPLSVRLIVILREFVVTLTADILFRLGATLGNIRARSVGIDVGCGCRLTAVTAATTVAAVTMANMVNDFGVMTRRFPNSPPATGS